MKDEKFRAMLADYLGGELDEQQVAAFRAELEANPERRKLADELQAAAAALEANVLSREEAERSTASLELDVATDKGMTLRVPSTGERPAGATHRRHYRLHAALRYAAVIVMAFGVGFLARGWLPANQEGAPPTAPAPTSINERYAARFVRATQSFPKSSTFSRSLLALARK